MSISRQDSSIDLVDTIELFSGASRYTSGLDSGNSGLDSGFISTFIHPEIQI